MNLKYYLAKRLFKKQYGPKYLKSMNYLRRTMVDDGFDWYLDVEKCACSIVPDRIARFKECPLCGGTGIRRKFSRRY